MNYNKIYNQIVERAQNRILEGYGENHHILPKCLGGTDENNIVRLTAREHFLCHLLLCEVYPHDEKLKYALFLMATGKRKHKNNYYIISSRTYERLKLEHSIFLTGVSRTEDTKQKISKSSLGKSKSEETKRKMSDNRKGHSMYNDEWREKISKANKGKKRSDEYRLKRSEAMKIIKRTDEWKQNISNNRHKVVEAKSIPIVQYSINEEFIKEWNNMTEASKSLNKKTPAYIGECCSGKKTSAYGFIWKYKIS
jgi:hypothetical protein